MSGPSREDHEHAGALFGLVRGVEVARHYGDPAEEYTSAVSGVAVRDRSHRSRLLVTGRAPVDTLSGVLTGRMPPSAGGVARRRREGDGGVLGGPHSQGKSRRRSKSHVGAQSGGGEPFPGCAPLPLWIRCWRTCDATSHPRLAAVEDVSDDAALLTVLGPGGGRRAGGGAARLGWGAEALESLGEDEYLVSGKGGERILRTSDVDTPAWDLFTSNERSRELWKQLLYRGVRPVGAGVWDTLRVEAGRPVFGQDMDESKILSEVGIVDRGSGPLQGMLHGTGGDHPDS